jgi:dolichol-phosphate mannosyltransferase
MNDSLLITVATYNERANVRTLVDRLGRLPLSFDLLIIDDDSPDGTGRLAHGLTRLYSWVHVLHREKRTGLGAALMAGFSWGRRRGYDLVLNLDGDLSHDPNEIPRLVDATRFADLVIGSRYTAGARIQAWPLHRVLLSRTAARCIHCVSNTAATSDPTSGFRCYRSQVLDAVLDQGIVSKGYAIHFEIAHLVAKMGFEIREVPIRFVGRASGRSKMNVRIISEAIWLLWRIQRGYGPTLRRTPLLAQDSQEGANRSSAL